MTFLLIQSLLFMLSLDIYNEQSRCNPDFGYIGVCMESLIF